jgi:glycosyltransferase involved in cell wall biosynthesis
VKVLVTGTGGSIVSGVSTAADEMTRVLPEVGHSAERLITGAQMRRRSNVVNLENVRAVLSDARAVFRRARRGRVDVVWIHTMGVPLLPALRALGLVVGARWAGRPAIVRFHAFGLEVAIDRGGRPLRVVLRALAALSAGLVAEHESAADALRGATRSRKVHVLYNWVEVPDDVVPMPSMAPLRLVFVGGVVRRKGAPQLIEAMRLLQDVEVELRLVGGPGEDGAEAFGRLQSDARDLVERGRVGFAGELDAKGVRAELQAGHLLVLPSDAEGMPLAMLEALAEGRPVLATDAGNMGRVIRDRGCGWLLPDRDPDTIAAHVRRVASDGDGVTLAGARASKAANEFYSPSAVRSQIDAILASTQAEESR